MTLLKKNLGQWGEQAALHYLEGQGFKVLATNVRNKIGEIDIVAKEGDAFCFIEVRTKSTDQVGHPFESITQSKKRKIYKAALWYIQENGLYDEPIRFDVVAVIPDMDGGQPSIELLRDAFTIDHE